MRKRAFGVHDVADSYESATNNPFGLAANTIGSLHPVTAPFFNGAAAVHDLYRGNLASAGLNAIGIIPGASLIRALGKGGRLGRAAAAAVPYVDLPAAIHAAGEGTHTILPTVTSVFARTGAQAIDQSRAMNRPSVQKQMHDQMQEYQNMAQDANKWRQHMLTLQQMGQQQSPYESKQAMAKEARNINLSRIRSDKIAGATSTAAPSAAPSTWGSTMKPIIDFAQNRSKNIGNVIGKGIELGGHTTKGIGYGIHAVGKSVGFGGRAIKGVGHGIHAVGEHVGRNPGAYGAITGAVGTAALAHHMMKDKDEDSGDFKMGSVSPLLSLRYMAKEARNINLSRIASERAAGTKGYNLPPAVVASSPYPPPAESAWGRSSMNFMRKHKIPLALSAIAGTGTGVYLTGRNRRKEEDDAATQVMAGKEAGFQPGTFQQRS